jgi:hypothetical protein
MQALYVISLIDSSGKMQSYGIAASTRNLAESEARRLAGVGEDVEPATSQKLHQIDSTVE